MLLVMQCVMIERRAKEEPNHGCNTEALTPISLEGVCIHVVEHKQYLVHSSTNKII